MSTATNPTDLPELVIVAWRNSFVRYKQTAIGVAWALVRLLLTTMVFTIIYSKVAVPCNGGMPSALLIFAATLLWQFFATSLSEASMSLIGNANLISKVYFPRLVALAAAVMTGLAGYLIFLNILLGLMRCYRFLLGWQLLTLPLWTAWAFLAGRRLFLWLGVLYFRKMERTFADVI